MSRTAIFGSILKDVQHKRSGVNVEVQGIVHKVVEPGIFAAGLANDALAGHDVTLERDLRHCGRVFQSASLLLTQGRKA